RNQRNNRLYSNCSQNIRSLRTVYSAIKSEAFNNRSGGIEGRPTSLYICSTTGESSLSATSASALISLIGWLAGTRCSGFTRVSIVACGRSCPRIFRFLLNLHPDRFLPLYRCVPIRRSHRKGIFQQPARARSASTGKTRERAYTEKES